MRHSSLGFQHMLGVIADDLTGAAEIGAVGLRYGLRAEILLGPPFALPGNTHPDLLCLDTDSRFCTPAEAARRAAAAARFLRRIGTHFIYKKVDSVLRGNVVAEIAAILKALCLDHALLVPANPSLGRTIRRGHYFVRGQPIYRTEFANDPAYPRKSSSVIELLGQRTDLPIKVCRPSDALPQTGVAVGNVATPTEMRRWAARRTPDLLLAGGADFFSAFLKSSSSSFSSSSSTPGTTKTQRRSSKQLFICGSTSVSTCEFIASQRQAGTPHFSLPSQLARGSKLSPPVARQIAAAAVGSLRSHDRVLLYVGLPLIRRPAIAQKLSTHLVTIAALILKHTPISHVFVEGGATAIELVHAMRLRHLLVLDELAPGVATLATPAYRGLLLTMKPGSYRWPF